MGSFLGLGLTINYIGTLSVFGFRGLGFRVQGLGFGMV